MDRRHRPRGDSTLPLLTRGYAWLPDLRRRHPGPVVRVRLAGRPAVALHGPEAVRFFYDERHVRRAGALPEPVRSTLFGHGAVHSPDGRAHRLRKAMFLSLLADPAQVRALVDEVGRAWDAAVERWAGQPRVVLLDEAARVLTEGVCRWAGLPLPPDGAAAFVAHTMHLRPEARAALAGGEPAHAWAFAQEVRRFYPFAPFVGGRAAADLTHRGEPIAEGTLVLLDLYGQNHDPALWGDPYAFRPGRFLERPDDVAQCVPQGGGDPAAGHRCPGEAVEVGLLEGLSVRLARLEYTLPAQDLTVRLGRTVARPRSGFVIEAVRAG
ncbi:cytochrome P450 [Kitasatospora cineracea]|uniref:cytochrome P450 n=1 Tax=Kitasatospora cineracea TaxID=88074 RepID=UPI0037A0CB3F